MYNTKASVATASHITIIIENAKSASEAAS